MPGFQVRIPLLTDIFLLLSKRSESLRGYCSAIKMPAVEFSESFFGDVYSSLARVVAVVMMSKTDTPRALATGAATMRSAVARALLALFVVRLHCAVIIVITGLGSVLPVIGMGIVSSLAW